MTIASYLQMALILGCIAVAFYCHLLSRRLRRLNDLETGLGGAIAVMTAEVTRLENAISQARDEAKAATHGLAAEIRRAEDERMRLRLGQQLSDLRSDDQPRRLRRKIPEKRRAELYVQTEALGV